MSASGTAPPAMLSGGHVASNSCAAERISPDSRRFSRSAPRSVLCGMPSALSATGASMDAAMETASSAPCATPPFGTATPKAARRAFASASSSTTGSFDRRRLRVRGSGNGDFQAAPIEAAHSMAVSASRTPTSGAMPRSTSLTAVASGRFSAIVAMIAPLPPAVLMACPNARTDAHQSLSTQRSPRGKSRTSRFASNPPRANAVNVSVRAVSSPQLKV